MKRWGTVFIPSSEVPILVQYCTSVKGRNGGLKRTKGSQINHIIPRRDSCRSIPVAQLQRRCSRQDGYLPLVCLGTLTITPLPTYVPALEPRADDSALKIPETMIPPVKTIVCKGKSYTFQELSGYGFVPSDARDKYGDTLSIGSSIAIERSSWKKLREGYYEGTLWGLPDRGWYACSTLGIYRDIL